MDSVLEMDNISRPVYFDNNFKKETNTVYDNGHHEYSLTVQSTACQTSPDHSVKEPSFIDVNKSSANCLTKCDPENQSPKALASQTSSESTLLGQTCINETLISDKNESNSSSVCNFNNSDFDNLPPTSCDSQCDSQCASSNNSSGEYKLTFEQLLRDYKDRKICNMHGEILKYSRTKICHCCTHCGKFYLCTDCLIDDKHKDCHDYDFECTDR